MTSRISLLQLTLFVCALLGAWPPAVRAQAQSGAVTMTIRAGYDGSYRAGEWFPVSIELLNTGPDVVGELEWQFPGQRNDPAFRTVVDLPRGAQKRVTMSAFSRSYARSGQVRLFSNDVVIAEAAADLDPIDPDRFLVAVASSDPTLLNALESVRIAGSAGTLVRHVRLEDLPPDVQSLRAVNALFLHDIDTAALSPAQRDTLSLWVSLGGQLVVSGGAGGQRTAAAVADMLPVEVGSAVTDGAIGAILALGRNPLPSQATQAPLVELRPRSGAQPLLSGLVYQQPYGAGLAAITAFDFALLRGWQSEPEVWDAVLRPVAEFVPGAGARGSNDNLLRAALQLPGLGLPSAGVLLLFLLSYIVILGPINYLVLRRLRRLEWAWISVPLIVLLFAGGLYVAGFGLRGSQSEVNQITVVQSTEGQRRGVATAFIGVFSPRRAIYSIALPPNSLVHDMTDWDEIPGRRAPSITRDSGVELPDVLVDVRSVRTIIAESSIDQPSPVESQLAPSGNELRGEIRNSSAEALDHVLLVRGGSYIDLGTLGPGGSRSVDTASASGNFPWSVSLPEDGIFNRKTLLTALFGGDYTRYAPSGAAPLGETGIYIVAWSDQPSVPVRVDGREQAQAGHTLYVVKLRS
jgi:hypothetical protein